jgi:hypothetical protein
VVKSHLRFAAGVCVIAAGLFMGGPAGAIAVAGADSHGSATHDHGADRSSQGRSPAGSTPSSPPGSVSHVLRTTLQGVTGALGPGRNLGPQASTGATSPKSVPGRTDNTNAKKQSGLVAAVPNVVAQVPSPAAPVTDAVAQVPNGAAPGTNVVAQAPNPAAPVTNAVVLVSDLVAPVTNAVAQVPSLVAPVTNAVVLVSDLVAPGANVFMLVPSLVATGVDVIVALRDVLTSVAGSVVTLTQQLPTDLASLFGVDGAAGPAAGIGGAGLAAVADAFVPAAPSVSQLLLPLLPTDAPGVPMVGDTAGAAALGAMAMTRVGLHSLDSSLPGTAALAKGGSLRNVLSDFQGPLCVVLLSVSLAALAGAALPGVGGLGIFTAAGVRVGYRQAKAGSALQPPGIARFARAGPLGVVRSGSLIDVRRGALSAQYDLDEAA